MSGRKSGGSSSGGGGNKQPGAAVAAAPPLGKFVEVEAADGLNVEVVVEEDTSKWKRRYMRDEVYSRRYKPSPAELRELLELEKFLGMANKRPGSFNRLLGGLGLSSSSGHGLGVGGGSLDDCVGRAAWDALIHPATSGDESSSPPEQPSSVILKRGPVLCRRGGAGGGNDTKEAEAKECELILLTHGLILASVVEKKKKRKSSSGNGNGGKRGSLGNSTGVVMRELDTALLWPAVRSVGPTSSERMWSVRLMSARAGVGGGGGGESAAFFVFECATPGSRKSWLDALEHVLVQSKMHNPADGRYDASKLGWQYRSCRFHRPAYALAVTGEYDFGGGGNGNDASDALFGDPDLDRCDPYNGYAPIHYAVRLNNLSAAKKILQAGANPNVAVSEASCSHTGGDTDSDEEGDGDQGGKGCTPMYFAVRDELPEMASLLKMHGASRSKQAESEQRGELFGRVDATQKEFDDNKKKKKLKEQEKADSAASQMQQNMAAMHRRGEKIERLDNKARELNEGAANYADMARQLKEQQKRKNNFFGLF